MYQQFDKILTEYEDGGDPWYDYGSDLAYKILEKFTDSDWKILFEQISFKNDGWKINLAYCLDDTYEKEMFLDV